MSKYKAVLLVLIVSVLVFSGILGISQAQEFGTAWSATFFNNTSLSGSPVATIGGINGLNFNWGTGVPIINGAAVPGVGADNFSARFTSTQNFTGGNYNFTAASDDGVRVYIDGALVLDRFIGRQLTTDTFQRTLTAGPHNLTVEYFEGTDQAVLQFQWGLTGAAATAGPSPTPGPTNTPLPTALPNIPSGAVTATIIRATVLNVRAEPSISAALVGHVVRGQTYQVIGRDKHAYWFLLQLSGFQGWVLGYYVYVNGNEFNAPIVSSYSVVGNPGASSPTGVVAEAFATLKLHPQPTIYSDQTGRITWGGHVAVLGKTASGEWYQVIWKGTVGWTWSSFLHIVEGDASRIPIVQP